MRPVCCQPIGKERVVLVDEPIQESGLRAGRTLRTELPAGLASSPAYAIIVALRCGYTGCRLADGCEGCLLIHGLMSHEPPENRGIMVVSEASLSRGMRSNPGFSSPSRSAPGRHRIYHFPRRWYL
jgi:hypothetical protein